MIDLKNRHQTLTKRKKKVRKIISLVYHKQVRRLYINLEVKLKIIQKMPSLKIKIIKIKTAFKIFISKMLLLS